jgi:hypothetical protein
MNARTIALETGINNSPLAIAVIVAVYIDSPGLDQILLVPALPRAAVAKNSKPALAREPGMNSIRFILCQQSMKLFLINPHQRF